ncbi:MAG TPA: ribose-5-phosphate isomerase RpiA [Sphingomonas sp.]|uniref:ribose-5-phosphate isomerase RpiA n=1 Tax=Sphingomonas sp. TaxID=28214 RepID=UPI002CE4B15D|nr:ribose-5-phosphate isomerase RpiA [Sphingomonas sp.]HMI19745.1 ribose-5-phosphate isomerase RpiA [Sphingomonas sp.]
MSQDDDKKIAALAAADEVKAGMLVGMGTGSTAAFLIDELGRRFAQGLRFRAVVTSLASERQAQGLGIPVLPFSDVAHIDLAIDGADEIDPQLRAIKGAGGAMLREKCVAASAARMVVIADGSKTVAMLGAAPVPCETLPFAQSFVEGALTELGARVVLRTKDGAPYRTDQDNLIFDCHFGAIADPGALAASLSSIPGMVGHGLFIDEIDGLYLAKNGSVTLKERPVAS